eukprot:6208699-Pleurochrysis_carterae.AAC.6
MSSDARVNKRLRGQPTELGLHIRSKVATEKHATHQTCTPSREGEPFREDAVCSSTHKKDVRQRLC